MTNENELKCFCIGLGIGTAAAMLLAPKSGAEARQYLQNKTLEGADYVKSQASSAVKAAGDVVDQSGRKIRHQKESVAAAVEAGKAAYQQAAATAVAN